MSTNFITLTEAKQVELRDLVKSGLNDWITGLGPASTPPVLNFLGDVSEWKKAYGADFENKVQQIANELGIPNVRITYSNPNIGQKPQQKGMEEVIIRFKIKGDDFVDFHTAKAYLQSKDIIQQTPSSAVPDEYKHFNQQAIGIPIWPADYKPTKWSQGVLAFVAQRGGISTPSTGWRVSGYNLYPDPGHPSYQINFNPFYSMDELLQPLFDKESQLLLSKAFNIPLNLIPVTG